ncbi:MAG: hypothetical protein A2Z91_04975 [Deltaproteobacteria bacterium GWA2_38_16]|nr:MAG: hypothetical protein A2Z91_04975 [Deltaproteobacteria bacterium GWA2_38_16]OGQ03134.1 MAG: hypothetical protein A3D19_03705 [Deltaproteobacteria bacterium RIFCSPHIGHO2_02_FULL_38_15]OGQ30017.1 MAG: hypothetical protein A3A72_09065 [Deltaproteobacteria bacterium RIFCSPLOWO2_01_FULL_38_9]OGQ61734.1 MAG: hypothetical protein A3G92_01725 [Deltaproteobacteria bacterium RIFCSPLOWO2_12_FULL_38_8]HBQ20445.1 hypothetical protein [Deltaproteobacteria bacterium]
MIKKIFFLLILNFLTTPAFSGGGGIDVSGGELEIFLRNHLNLSACLTQDHLLLIEDIETQERAIFPIESFEVESLGEDWVLQLPTCGSF